MALADYVRLEWFGQPPYDLANRRIDITDRIESLDKFADASTGETCSASVMLRAFGGDFVTEANSDTTPIIRPFDLFRLAVVDDGGNLDAAGGPTPGRSFWRWMIQGQSSPQKTGLGQHLTLDLHGREWFLQQIIFPGRFFFVNFKEVARQCLSFYNDNRSKKSAATHQPAIDLEEGAGRSTINIPTFTYGIFEFGDSVTCYDALMEVVRRLDLPVAAGGDGQHHGVRFADKSWSDPSEMVVSLGPRGGRGDARAGNDLPDPLSFTEVREPPGATVVVVEGQEGAGTIPPQIAEFRGYVEEWNNLPFWDRTIAYPAKAYVRHKGRWFRANKDAPAGTEPSATAGSNHPWSDVFLQQYLGDQGETEPTQAAPYQYSPWTANKHVSGARNWFANPTGSMPASGVDSVACPDHNLVIRDDVLSAGGRGWRTWVDCRATAEGGIPATLLYPAATGHSRFYHGLRVLNATGATGGGKSFPNPDKFGKSTENAVLVMDRDGDWIVFKEPELFNEVAVLAEARIYEYNRDLVTIPATAPRARARKVHNPAPTSSTAGMAWRDISPTLMGADCFHYPESIAEADGLVPLPPRSGDASLYRTNSAIQIEYHRNELEEAFNKITTLVAKLLGAVGLGAVFDFFGDATKTTLKDDLTDGELDLLDLAHNNDSYNDGWWTVLFETPFPKAKLNGIGENVGQLYGGTTAQKVPLFDAQNQTYTPTGKRGWTAADADYLGQTEGFYFLFNFNIEGPAWLSIPGNIPASATIYDHYDNVWKARTTIRFQKITQAIYIPWSSCSIYRARMPPALTPESYVRQVIKPELATTEVFDPRLIKRICFQVDIGYDDEGRYDPWSWEAFLRKWILQAPNATVKFIGRYDAFCFVRKGLAIAVNDKVKNGELPRIDKKISHPSISNAIQLRKIARAELDVALHENDYISVKYERYCGAQAEQKIIVKDDDFIDGQTMGAGDPSPKSNTDGTLEMIVRKATYSVTGRSGAGGLVTDLELFRKVNFPRRKAIAA